MPTIDLSTAQRSLARTNQEDRREKIKENFGKKFEQESKKEEEIGAAINVLEQFNLDSARPRKFSSPTTLTPPATRKERILSHETFIRKHASKEKITPTDEQMDISLNIATKTPEITLTPQQSPTPTPPNTPLQSSTEIIPETPRIIQTPPQTPRGVNNEIPQIPITPPLTPSPEPTPPGSPSATGVSASACVWCDAGLLDEPLPALLDEVI